MIFDCKWLCIAAKYPQPSFDFKSNGDEKMKKNTVRVFDTISKKVVRVEVSDEVRTHYKRTQWNIDDNNKSFYKHEIQFSALIGGHKNAYENFHEFHTEKDIVEKNTIKKTQ